MKSVCVYCGSSPGRHPAFVEAAKELGHHLASRSIRLVYGGGHVGMMGTVADACLAAGGEVTGVIPVSLQELELGHTGLTEMYVVDSMHERKALMSRLSDGFIVLPGGLGTLDEMFEALTWSQLRIQDKPCGLLNVQGYYDSLLAFIERMVEERFLLPEHRGLLVVDTDAASLLDRLDAYEPLEIEGWIERKISADLEPLGRPE